MSDAEQQLLPVGSVVYLKGGTEKVTIMSRGELMKPKEGDSKQTYFDYMGSVYPQGYDKENSYYFNHEAIEDVVFVGFQDEDEKRYLKVLKEWREQNKDDYVIGITE